MAFVIFFTIGKSDKGVSTVVSSIVSLKSESYLINQMKHYYEMLEHSITKHLFCCSHVF